MLKLSPSHQQVHFVLLYSLEGLLLLFPSLIITALMDDGLARCESLAHNCDPHAQVCGQSGFAAG